MVETKGEGGLVKFVVEWYSLRGSRNHAHATDVHALAPAPVSAPPLRRPRLHSAHAC